MSDWVYLGVAALAGAGGVLLLRPGGRGERDVVQQPSASLPISPAPPAATPSTSSASSAPPGCLPVLDAGELVARAGIAGRLARIQQKLAFSPENHSRDVAPLLEGFARFVQLLPASQSHHHAQPGGLLIHLLEVAEYALHFRDAYKLPIGAITEEQIRLAARYSYAVLVAALLHDIGKPVSDLSVQLLDGGAGAQPRMWVALAGPMAKQGARWYRVGFPDRRDYEAHKRLPVVLLQRLVPSAALTWLGEYRPLLQELIDYLGGDRREGILSEIVGKADRRSVADNLLNGPRTRFASARSVPLIERLMGALRRVLTEGGFALNRAGATAYCDGESLWCVAGTVAKAVRDWLNQHEEREADAAGIPEDNNRLFDTWQEYGALTPNSSGGAIWNVRVRIAEWEQTFTVLRFPLERLYPSPDRYPQSLPAGAIEPVESRSAAAVPVAPASATVAASSAPAPAPADDAADRPETVAVPDVESGMRTVAVRNMEPASSTNMSQSGLHTADAENTETAAVLSGPSNTAAESAQQKHPNDGYPSFDDAPADYLDEHESAHGAPPPQVAAAPLDLQAPVRPWERTRAQPRQGTSGQAGGPAARPNAARFLAWIQQGIADGSLAWNEANAFVHFVPEGMLVISPKAFQEFAVTCADAIDIEPGKPLEPWRVVQRDFQRSGYPEKGEGGTYMHYYTVSGPGGRRLVAQLVPDPARFFNPVPPANPLIQSKKDTSGI